MYNVYAQMLSGGYVINGRKKELQDARELASRLDPKKYYSYMIIKKSEEGDEIIENHKLYEECKVEIGEVKTDYEIRTTTFIPKQTRAQKKEELRKLTKDYLDR